jgi:CBS domain containing-hemolysin-like protein
MIIWNILLLILLILLNAFFVSVEFSAVSARRSRLDLMADEKSAAVRIVKSWLENTESRDYLIAACQLGITIVSLALGSVGENTFKSLLEPLFQKAQLPPGLQFINAILPALPLVISLIIVSGIHVVFGEQVPKVSTLRNPERFAIRAAPYMSLFSRIFKGFINLLNWITKKVLLLIGTPADGLASHGYSRAEIKQLFAGPEVEGILDPTEREMLNAVIELGETVIRKVSIPRTEILAIEADASLDEMIKTIMHNSVSKYPVFEDNLDAIVGIIHIRDLLPLIQHAPDKKVLARDLVRPALFVPESISIDDLLSEFRTHHQHLAIVLDEYGGTAGMVTLEDLVEEILGDLKDPFDSTTPPIEDREDGTALVDGLTLIEEVNDHFTLNLDDPNFDTIAGYIIGKLGRIPKLGDIYEDVEHRVSFKVESMDRLRIDRVLIKRL